MHTKELVGLPVNLDWTPTTNIKPHHIVNYIPMGFVDKLKFYMIAFPQALYFTLRDSQDQYTFYNQDVYGSSGTPQDTLRQELKESFFKELLRNLPNDSVVQLNLAPDGICKSCVTGKHCKATNFRALGRRWNLVDLEKPKLRQIRRRLLKNGFQPEIDFKIIQVNTELLDYQGENLWTNLHPPQPITAQYNAMLVRMSALRKIVDNKF